MIVIFFFVSFHNLDICYFLKDSHLRMCVLLLFID